MNFGLLFKAFDTAVLLREAAKRFKSVQAAETGLAQTQTGSTSALTAPLEARLTNVVVAALKEAFDRDHARLELERAQLDEQRRRVEEATRLELRRQAADREIGRLRLLGGTALIGWITSVLLMVARLGSVSAPSRAVMAVGWLLLLGALGAAFSAQGRAGAFVADGARDLDTGPAGRATLWLLIAGLGLSAASLLV